MLDFCLISAYAADNLCMITLYMILSTDHDKVLCLYA